MLDPDLARGGLDLDPSVADRHVERFAGAQVGFVAQNFGQDEPPGWIDGYSHGTECTNQIAMEPAMGSQQRAAP